MKKKIIIALALAISMFSYGQERMKVQLTDGRIIEYDIAEVARVYFETPNNAGEAVDLGLSVLWSTCNLGAASAAEVGNYYSWGATEPCESKDLYSEENYDYIYRGDDISETKYDAAFLSWGNQWRLPSKSEALELAECCSWMPTQMNGISGYKVVGPNGNSIFLPASGFYSYGVLNHGETCNYWTSTETGWDDNLAWNLYCQSSGPSVLNWYNTSTNKGKYWGMPIRPVSTKVTLKTGGEGATANNPKDMTSALWCPSYDKDKYYGWRGTDPTNISNGCFEQWNTTFDNFQDINGLPAGVYKIDVQGFYRKGYAEDDYKFFIGSNPSSTDYAVVYAHTSEAEISMPLACASSGALVSSLGGSAIGLANGKFIPNDMASAACWFNAGYYKSSINVKVGTDGKLRLGFKKSQLIEGDWVIVDNWRLTYYGNGEVPQDKLYDEPYTSWNSSVNTVKANMKGNTLISEETTDDGGTLLAYSGNNQETLIIYRFVPEFELVEAQVLIETSKTTIEEIDQQIQKNYLYIDEINGFKMYMSEDGETTVLLAENTSIGHFSIDYYSTRYLIIEPTPTTYFEEPFVGWGVLPNVVKRELSNRGYTLYDEGVSNNGSRYLSYYGKYEEALSIYTFNELQMLSQIDFAFLDVTLDELKAYLTTQLGYSYVGEGTNDEDVYGTPDEKSYAFVYSSTLSDGTVVCYITYIKRTTTSTRTAIEGQPMGRMFKDETARNLRCLDAFKHHNEKRLEISVISDLLSK